MFLKCNKCGKDFNLMDGGYLGSPNLDDQVCECDPFMKLSELCEPCYRKALKEKSDAENVQTKTEKGSEEILPPAGKD